jgi:choice-of-anchor C domain-containing protein
MRTTLRSTTGLLAYLIIAFGGSPKAGADFILNGGFELGPPPGSQGFITHQVGTGTLPNWEVFQSNVDVIAATNILPVEGSRTLDLHGESGPGGVRQSFSTQVDAQYLLTFFQSAQPFPDNATNPRDSTVRVNIAGLQQDFTFNTTGVTVSDPHWVQRVLNFTAISPTTTLQFLSLDPGVGGNGFAQFRGPEIDAVAVTAVPEPASVVMLCIGVLGASAYCCHRRKVAHASYEPAGVKPPLTEKPVECNRRASLAGQPAEARHQVASAGSAGTRATVLCPDRVRQARASSMSAEPGPLMWVPTITRTRIPG